MSPSAVHESAIMERLILSPEKAEAIVSLAFAPEDQERMRELMDRNNQRSLTDSERAEMEGFRRCLASCRRGPGWPLARHTQPNDGAMNSELRQFVWTRSNGSCEYCRMPDEFDPLPFGIDHIRPQYHHGPSTAENLCVSCFSWNTFKAVNIAGHDPDTGELTRLFHPRDDNWDAHFAWDGPHLRGLTAVGRETIDVLRMNLPERVEHRRLLLELGVFPASR